MQEKGPKPKKMRFFKKTTNFSSQFLTITKIALKLLQSCKANSEKRKSKCRQIVFRELSEKVRDSNESGLNIILEKGKPNESALYRYYVPEFQ